MKKRVYSSSSSPESLLRARLFQGNILETNRTISLLVLSRSPLKAVRILLDPEVFLSSAGESVVEAGSLFDAVVADVVDEAVVDDEVVDEVEGVEEEVDGVITDPGDLFSPDFFFCSLHHHHPRISFFVVWLACLQELEVSKSFLV